MGHIQPSHCNVCSFWALQSPTLSDFVFTRLVVLILLPGAMHSSGSMATYFRAPTSLFFLCFMARRVLEHAVIPAHIPLLSYSSVHPVAIC